MNLNETNFGRIVVELNNFTRIVNPEVIADFETMPDRELKRLSEQDSVLGKVAKSYLFLIESMRIVSSPVNLEQVNPDVPLDDEEETKENYVKGFKKE